MGPQRTDAPGRRRRIAVLGAGISGLGAAWLLSRAHDVVLYEAANRLGGHARTLVVRTRGREVPVDAGFIVFNRVNYPNLCRLFERLRVPVHKSCMSFAVSVDGGALEYGGGSLRAVLAQPANTARPAFWRMCRDIAVFNRTALADACADPELTVGGLIRRRRFGEIADDVGTGRTIEAGLMLRELIDRGACSVLCPPHLVKQ